MARTSSKLRGSPGGRILRALCLAAVIATAFAIEFGDIYNSGFYITGETGSSKNDVSTGSGFGNLLKPEYTAAGWVFKVTYFESQPKPKAGTQKLYLKVVDHQTATATSVKPNCDRDKFKSCDLKDFTGTTTSGPTVSTVIPIPDASTLKKGIQDGAGRIYSYEVEGETGLSVAFSLVDQGLANLVGCDLLDNIGATPTMPPCGVNVVFTITEAKLADMGVDMAAGAASGGYKFGLIAGYYEEADPELHKENANSAAAGNALVDFAYHQELFKVSYSDRAIYVVCDKNQEASFLRFAYARIHEVPDATDREAPKQYYASVSFAVTPELDAYAIPDKAGGSSSKSKDDYLSLVDLSSLRAKVVRGSEEILVIDGTTAGEKIDKSCGFVKNATVDTGVFKQACAPQTKGVGPMFYPGDRFCAGSFDSDQGYATFYYPLGSTDPTDSRVVLDFVIQLQDSGSSNIIFESVQLTVNTVNGLIEWCQGASGVQVNLATDIKVQAFSGINLGGLESMVPYDVTGLPDLALLNEPTKSQTAMDGLITLTAEYTDPDSELRYEPVLEELWALHVYLPPVQTLDPCDGLPSLDVKLAPSGKPFIDWSALPDGWSAPLYDENITGSVCKLDDIADLTSTTDSPKVEIDFNDNTAPLCALRHIVSAGEIKLDKDILEITHQGDPDDGADFLAHIAKHSSGGNAAAQDTAKDLGKSFYESLAAGLADSEIKEGDSVIGYEKKIWWVNPGYFWSSDQTPAQYISLSTTVCVVALFRFDPLGEGDGDLGGEAEGGCTLPTVEQDCEDRGICIQTSCDSTSLLCVYEEKCDSAGEKPHCLADVTETAFECVKCRPDEEGYNDCVGEMQYCSADHECVKCAKNWHCNDGNPCTLDTCNNGECAYSSACTGVKDICVESENVLVPTCVECVEDQNCTDSSKPFCSLGQCVACEPGAAIEFPAWTGGEKPSGNLNSCQKQDQCMDWTITPEDGCVLGQDNCLFEVCLTLDFDSPTCGKTGTISHTCPREDDGKQSHCGELDGGSVLLFMLGSVSPGHGHSQCQTGYSGELLQFNMKDADACEAKLIDYVKVDGNGGDSLNVFCCDCSADDCKNGGKQGKTDFAAYSDQGCTKNGAGCKNNVGCGSHCDPDPQPAGRRNNEELPAVSEFWDETAQAYVKEIDAGSCADPIIKCGDKAYPVDGCSGSDAKACSWTVKLPGKRNCPVPGEPPAPEETPEPVDECSSNEDCAVDGDPCLEYTCGSDSPRQCLSSADTNKCTSERHCVRGGTGFDCVDCILDDHCSGEQVCSGSFQCVDCLSDADCNTDEVCDRDTNECVEGVPGAGLCAAKDSIEISARNDGEADTGNLNSCKKQDRCLKWRMTALTSCDNVDCEFEVCLITDFKNAACGKSETGTISHTCPKDGTRIQDVECSGDFLAQLGSLKKEGVPHDWEQCQRGYSGEALRFNMKDADGCEVGYDAAGIPLDKYRKAFELSDVQDNCGTPNIVCGDPDFPVSKCTGQKEGPDAPDCSWTFTIPGSRTCPAEPAGRRSLAATSGIVTEAEAAPPAKARARTGQPVRRTLQVSSSASAKSDVPNGVGGARFRFGVTPASMAASMSGVAPEFVTSWNLDLEVSAADACLPAGELVSKVRAQIITALDRSAATAVKNVQVVSLTLNKNGVECRRAKHQRRLLAGQSPTVSTQTLIIFDDAASQKPSLDVNELENVPGILSATQTDVQSSGVVEVTPKVVYQDTVEPESGSGSSNVPIIAGAAGGAVVVVGVAALLLWRRSAGSGSRDLEVAQVPPALALDNKLADMHGELDDGARGSLSLP